MISMTIQDALIEVAHRSPCRLSRRAAAVFAPLRNQADRDDLTRYGPILGIGSNGVTRDALGASRGACQLARSCTCPADFRCSEIATHAEARAIVAMRPPRRGPGIVELVHLKISGEPGSRGMPMPSGAPSCMPCAALAHDAGVSSVWLLHEPGRDPYWLPEDLPHGSVGDTPPPDRVLTCERTGWTRYPIEVFWNVTARHVGVPSHIRIRAAGR